VATDLEQRRLAISGALRQIMAEPLPLAAKVAAEFHLQASAKPAPAPAADPVEPAAPAAVERPTDEAESSDDAGSSDDAVALDEAAAPAELSAPDEVSAPDQDAASDKAVFSAEPSPVVATAVNGSKPTLPATNGNRAASVTPAGSPNPPWPAQKTPAVPILSAPLLPTRPATAPGSEHPDARENGSRLSGSTRGRRRPKLRGKGFSASPLLPPPAPDARLAAASADLRRALRPSAEGEDDDTSSAHLSAGVEPDSGADHPVPSGDLPTSAGSDRGTDADVGLDLLREETPTDEVPPRVATTRGDASVPPIEPVGAMSKRASEALFGHA
jgi:hypothetical protein